MAVKKGGKPVVEEEEEEEVDGEEEESGGKQSFWDDVKDLFEGEDESVVASAKARVLAGEINSRRAAKKLAEEEAAGNKGGKGGKGGKKKGSGWL